MSENRMVKSIRGTRDLLPGDTEAWDVVEGVVREVMAIYQYREIRTPLFEETQLFTRGIGEHTDIVSKEMYTFEDQGGRSLTLRPEGTAPVVRAYLEHKLGAQGTLNKFYYMGPMFRQEAPQKGRARQFHQFGAEIIGADAPEADAEIILLFLAVIDALGLDSWKLQIGSLGCSECRPAYREELVAFLKGVEDLLCEDCRERIDTNPLRILDCKREGCRLATAKAPSQIDFLDPECSRHFEAVQTLLEKRNVPFKVDPRMVRGLDYYERTTFEVTNPDLGAQDAICGGGRYDGLAEMLGSEKRVPGVGFAAGLERIMLALEAAGEELEFEPLCEVALVYIGEEARHRMFTLCDVLRRAGVACTIDLTERSVKAQMREANRREALIALIAGEKDLQENNITVKNLVDGVEEKIPFEKIVPVILERLETMDETAIDEEPEDPSAGDDGADPQQGEAA